MTPYPTHEMLDKTLLLISKGDAAKILENPELQITLNELMKHQLVEVYEDKIILTPKGMEAIKTGSEHFLKLQKQESAKLIRQPSTPEIKKRVPSELLIFLLVLLATLIIAYMLYYYQLVYPVS